MDNNYYYVLIINKTIVFKVFPTLTICDLKKEEVHSPARKTDHFYFHSKNDGK